MAENVQSDIIINVDTSVGIAEIKNLQRQIASLNSQLVQSGTTQARAAQNIQRNLINNINATGDFAARVKTIASTTETFTTRLEKNKLGMGEYFKYAGGASKTFGRLFRSEFDTIEKVARERVKTLQTQYVKLGRDASGALKAISVRPLALDMENLATKTAMAAQKQQLMNQLLKQGSTNLLNFGKNTQWAGRQLMVGFSIPLAYLGTTAAKTFMQMEEQVIKFKRVYGDTFTSSSDTDKMIKQIQVLANEYTKFGVAAEKTMEMAATAAAAGKQGAELIAQVAEATRLSVLGGVEQAQALETTISLTNAFGVAADKLSNKVDFLNAVENQTVTSIEDLTIAIPKAGPVVQQLGGDVEDLTFFLTAMKEGGINASEGANALKSGLAALINPTGKASEMLGAMGINIKGIVEANKGDVKGTVIGFSKALDTLDPLNRARAIEQLFGKFQFSRLSTLFKNVIDEGSQASKVLKLANSTTQELAILSERELKRVQESPMYKFKKSVEDIKVSLIPLGEAFIKAVTPIVEFVKGFLDKFNEMGDGAKQFAVIATTVVAGIGPVLLMTFGLIANGAANLIKLFLGLGKMFNRTGAGSQTLGSQTEYMTQQQLEAAAVAASLDQRHSKLIQTFTSESAAVDKLASAYGRAIVAQSNLMGVPVAAGVKAAKKPKKFATGVVSVPGPKGAGDIVPAMLAPGESVIPADMTQKYGPLISAMVSGKIPGFEAGVVNFGGRQFSTASQAGQKSIYSSIEMLVSNGIDKDKIIKRLEYLQDKSIKAGKPYLTAKDLSRHFGFKSNGEPEFSRGSGKSAAPEKLRLMGQPAQVEFEQERKFLQDRLAKSGVVLTDGQLKNALQMQASHILPDSGPEGKNWTNLKNIIPDLGYINGYVNDLSSRNNKFSKTLIELAAKSPDILTKKGIDIDNLTKILSGVHPTSKSEIATLKAIAKEHMKFIGPQGRNLYRPMMVNEGIGFRESSGYYNNPIATYEERVSSGQFRGGPKKSTIPVTGRPKASQVKKTTPKAQTVSKKASAISLSQILKYGKLKGYAKGVVSVPGPKGAGDVVPAMLAPGESVIPAKMTKKYGSLITGMVNGTIPGFFDGLDGGDAFGPSSNGAFDNIPTSSSSGSFGQASSDPFGSSSDGAFDKKAGKKFGSSIAEGMKSKFLPVAGQIGKNIGAEFAGSAKNLGGRIAEKVQNSGAQFVSKTRFGKSLGEIKGAKGKSFIAGAEVRTDKAGREYGYIPGVGRTSAEQARGSMAPAGKDPATAKQRFANGAQKAGMIGMGVSMAAGAATMLPGEAGKVAGDIAPVLMGLSSLAMLVQGPVSAALVTLVAAIGLPIYAMMKANEAFDTAQKKALDLAEAMGSGSKAIQTLAESAGNVTGKEIMDKRRQEGFSAFQIKPGKTTFGQSYMQSDAGKALLANTQKTITEGGGAGAATKQITSQMATAVSSGALSAKQARSVVANLAQEMGDYSFGIQVNSELISMLGPNGEDLLKDPLGVRVELLKAEQANITDATKNLNTIVSKGFSGAGEAITGAIAGAGVGAAIGAAIGSVIPGIGTGIVAAVGGAIGAVSGGITGAIMGNEKHQKDIAQASAASVAIQKMALEQQQEISDSLEIEYEKRIAVAQAAGDTAEAERLINERQAARLTILKESTTLNAQILKSFKDITDADTRKALVSGADKAITSKYKGTAQEDVATLAATRITDSKMAEEKKYMLKLELSTGAIDPMQMLKLLAMPEKSQDIIFNVATTFGGAAAGQIETITSLFVDKNGKPVEKVQTDFLLAVKKAKTPEELNNLIEFYKKISQSGAVLDVAVMAEYLLKNPKVAAQLDAIFDKIDSLKGPITVDILAKVVNADAIAAINDDIAYFNTLNDSEKKIYTQTLVTTLSTITAASPEFLAWKKDQGAGYKRMSQGTQLAKFAEWNAQVVTETSKDGTTGDGGVDTGGDTSGGGAKTEVLDDLLKRLQNVRKAAVNAAGGLKELMKWQSSGKAFAGFKGIEQQLGAKGYNADFVRFMADADTATQKRFMTTTKGIVVLKKEGQALQNLFSSVTLGNYQLSIQDAIKATKDELGARSSLINLTGMGYADAVEASRDSGLAEAIAAIKSNTAIKNKNKEIKSTVDLYKQQKAAAKTVQTTEEKLADVYQKAMDYFAPRVQLIELNFTADTKAYQDAINAAQAEIDKKTNEAGGLDDLQAGLTRIGWQEDEINTKYDTRLTALDKVAEANSKISAAQKDQLGLADALSRGDIAGAARAAQEMRANQAQDAISAQKTFIENSREYEISQLSATVNGQKLTRKDIEAKILKIEKEIFEIEESRLEPNRESIRVKDLEKVVALTSLELQKAAWEKLSAEAAIAATAAWDYASALEAAKKLMVDSEFPAAAAAATQQTMIDRLKTRLATSRKAGAAADTPAELAAAVATSKALLADIAKAESDLKPLLTAKAAEDAAKTPAQIAAEAKAKADAEVKAKADAEKLAADTKAGGTPPPAVKTAAELTIDRLNERIAASRAAGAAATTPAAKAAAVATTLALSASIAKVTKTGALSMGGMVPKFFASGGFAKGTDTVPAMLTPGEFVVKKFAVDNFGADNLKAINSGTYSGGSVYNNYDVNINVKSDANANDIARTVITEIKRIDSQRIRGNRFNG